MELTLTLGHEKPRVLWRDESLPEVRPLATRTAVCYSKEARNCTVFVFCPTHHQPGRTPNRAWRICRRLEGVYGRREQFPHSPGVCSCKGFKTLWGEAFRSTQGDAQFRAVPVLY